MGSQPLRILAVSVDSVLRQTRVGYYDGKVATFTANEQTNALQDFKLYDGAVVLAEYSTVRQRSGVVFKRLSPRYSGKRVLKYWEAAANHVFAAVKNAKYSDAEGWLANHIVSLGAADFTALTAYYSLDND